MKSLMKIFVALLEHCRFSIFSGVWNSTFFAVKVTKNSFIQVCVVRCVMCLVQGPLVALRNFHPDLLKICQMHTLNLGLLFNANGAAMTLGI